MKKIDNGFLNAAMGKSSDKGGVRFAGSGRETNNSTADQVKKELILELQNVEISYGKKNILSGASCRVEKGDFIAVTGKSGGGKSTLLYVLGGFLRPSSGLYLFENKRVYRVGEIGLGKFRKKNIGFLFQDFRLLPFLTIEQNILFPIYFTGDTVPRERTNELLNLLGLEHRRKAFPADISGGETQRTALARALLLEPKLLLLDEPTGNLDLETEQEVIEQLLDLKRRGFTIICVTHSLFISKEADYVWHISNGNIKITENHKKSRNKTSQKTAENSTPKAGPDRPLEGSKGKVRTK